MKQFFQNTDNTFQRVILYLITGIVAVLILVTLISFTARKAKPGQSWRKADPSPQKVINMSARKDGKVAAYTSLGELRAVSKAPEGQSTGAIIVVTPWFAYSDGDSVLFEELSDKNRKCKSLILEYFSTHTAKELHSLGEKKVKEDLLSLINNELVLGKIEAVYFDTYVFLE